MYKIALEEHFGTPEIMKLRLDWFKRDNLPLNFSMEEAQRIGKLACDTAEFRLAEMDKHGIKKMILTPGSNGVDGVLDDQEALEVCQRWNEAVYQEVKANPDRFDAFAMLPLRAPELAADELERCVTKYGFKGCGWLAGYVYKCGFIDEEKFHPLFARAEKLGVPLYLHPTETPNAFKAIYEGHPALLGPTWSWNTDTATYMLRIIFSGLLDKFPKTTIIMGHMGEMLPYVLWRVENRLEINPMDVKLEKKLSQYFQDNIYITTSGQFNNCALRCAIEFCGAERIMFSIDYPFEPVDLACEFMDNASIPDDQKRLISHANAEKLLNL